jgi:hypothetical protein
MLQKKRGRELTEEACFYIFYEPENNKPKKAVLYPIINYLCTFSESGE